MQYSREKEKGAKTLTEEKHILGDYKRSVSSELVCKVYKNLLALRKMCCDIMIFSVNHNMKSMVPIY